MTVPQVLPLITERGRQTDYWYQDLTHQLLSSQNSLYFGNFKWETNAAYQTALRKLTGTTDVPMVEMQLNTFTYETKLSLPSNKKSEYIVGIQGMSQNNRNLNNRVSQFLPNANVNNVGFLAMAQRCFFDKLRLQGGLRFDIYNTETFALGQEGETNYHAAVSKYFSNLNGSFGATFSPTEKIMIRANFAKGFRAPNLSELTSNGMHGNRFEVGNENLLPENSFETDASMHYHGVFFSFDLAVFYNKINNYIYIAPTADTTTSGLTVYRFSQSNATLYGGEAGLHFHPVSIPWLHLKGSYAAVIGKQENGDYLPFIPAHKFRYELSVKRDKLGFLLNPYLKLSALTALEQNHPSPFETITKGYTLVNIGAYSDIRIAKQKMVVGLSVNNLFDTQYIDHLSTLKAMNYYNPGRNISLSLHIPFALKQ